MKKNAAKNKGLYLLLLFLTIVCLNIALSDSSVQKEQKSAQGIPKGVWVTVFSKKNVLYSKDAAAALVEFCKKSDISEIYLQLYRSGKAYYDSKITDRAEYEKMVAASGADTIDFLINESGKNNIRVFAWVNVLSLGQNKTADIVARFGEGVLTRDQYLRISSRNVPPRESDKYYLKDDQIFLEPGDGRVAEYASSICEEIAARYPKLGGIHLDYIRYPSIIPFLPDSRFNDYGLTYGYGESNIAAFKKETGLDPLSIKDEREACLMWDNWKRQKVTALVEGISKRLKERYSALALSCAVMSPERAYSVCFQDWPSWLETGIVDYVVLMNYTTDNRFAEETLRSALAHRGRGRIYAGIGAFLMTDKPQLFSEQRAAALNLKADGIVFFSYDDLDKFF